MLSGAELKKLESQIAELKVSVATEKNSNRQLSAEVDLLRLQGSESQLEKEQFQKERDLCRFQLERVQEILTKDNLLDTVLKHLNEGS